MMWSAGIVYIFLGLMPYWTKRLGLTLNPQSLNIFRLLGWCGVAVLLLSIAGIFLDEPLRTTLAVSPVLIFGVVVLIYMKKAFPLKEK